MNKKNIINVAVIGVGNMGKHHARNYQEMQNVRLIAVCDTNEKTGNEIAKLYSTKFYKNSDELVSREKPDAVSIAVPTFLHKKIASLCIKKKIHVLLEKPIASSVNDGKYLKKLADTNNVLLMVGHIERYNPAVITLNSLIKKGAVGDILSIIVKRVGPYPPITRNIDVVTDLAVHDLDIITSLVGSNPKSVYARGGGKMLGKGIDHAEIFLNYDKFGCFIQTNWITPTKIRTMAVTGTKAYVELNYITQELDLFKAKTFYSESKKFNEVVTEVKNQSKISIVIKKKEPLKSEIEDFIKCIKTKKLPIASNDAGIQAVHLAAMVKNSIYNNRVINYHR